MPDLYRTYEIHNAISNKLLQKRESADQTVIRMQINSKENIASSGNLELMLVIYRQYLLPNRASE